MNGWSLRSSGILWRQNCLPKQLRSQKSGLAIGNPKPTDFLLENITASKLQRLLLHRRQKFSCNTCNGIDVLSVLFLESGYIKWSSLLGPISSSVHAMISSMGRTIISSTSSSSRSPSSLLDLVMSAPTFRNPNGHSSICCQNFFVYLLAVLYLLPG